MWRIPKIWEGGTCWIIGGGPSMPVQFGIPEDIINNVRNWKLTPDAYSPYLSVLHDKHVIGINSAYLLGQWIDVIFFGDKRWYLQNRTKVAKFEGLKVTCNARLKIKDFKGDDVKYVSKDNNKAFGITERLGKVSWNKNSGAAAINLAYHAGVKRVILLGFDMNLDEGKNMHWHNEYQNLSPKKTDTRGIHNTLKKHLQAFPKIARDAKQLGLEIVNASPDSKITQFPKLTVEEILKNE